MPRLSVVIITWNQCEKLRNCLESILRSDNGGQDVEIIVVDNHSADETIPMLESYKSKIRLMSNEKNMGVAFARNQGIKAARGDYVMMLDDDTEVREGCFSRIINFMERNDDCWCLGTKQLRPDGILEYNAKRFYDLATAIARRTPLGRIMKHKVREHLMLDLDHNSTSVVDWVAGGSFVMRVEAIRCIGDFDEAYFFGFEDIDWCHRLKLAGKKTYYLHDAVIVHYVQRTNMKFFSRKAFGLFLSSVRYYVKFRKSKFPG